MKSIHLKRRFINLILLLVISVTAVPNIALAVPPPDFIINIGTQLASFFGIAVVFATAILASAHNYIKIHFARFKFKKIHWISGIVAILVIAGASSYYYNWHYQKVAYEQWWEESEQRKGEIPKEDSSVQMANEIDDLIAPDVPEIAGDLPKIPEDPGTSLIKQYYFDIADHRFKEAYEVSKKTVSFETFSGWYAETNKIIIDDILKIDREKYSLELTLIEGDEGTRYGVLMTLALDEQGMPISIRASEVRTLGNFYISDDSTGPVVIEIQDSGFGSQDSGFFEKNKSSDLLIGNAEFKKALDGGGDYIVLDAREEIEFENGSLPGSTHIRFADLKAGRWIELPDDKHIYVICWSGIRGKEVAEFLRKKELSARYLESGADGWVSYGGKWDGDIKFTKVYSDSRYKLVFDTETVKKKIKEGVKIVDSRPPSKFNAGHIPGSVNIPLMYTPTSELQSVFSKLSAGGSVITVCDDYVNCFDARLTGVELERRGYKFLGRYNKPWDY